MRAMKFRAWDKTEKTMFEVVLIEWSAATSDEISRMLLVDLHHPYTVKQVHRNDSAIDTDYVLLQFTGILDRNKQEIYEGDVVRHGNAVTDIVEYIEGGFVLCIQRLSDVPHKEVIGNIYEHPERISECAQARRRSIHDAR